MKKTICILGSTGSIGTQTIEVARHIECRVAGISLGKNVPLAEEQVRLLKPDYCAVRDEEAAKELKNRISDTNTAVLAGENAATELAAVCKCDTVLDAVSGFAGLFPALEAIKSGKNLAIANKESLVAAGPIVKRELEKHGVTMLPVDSEHCAIHQCIDGHSSESISRLIITASGGAFFGKTPSELENVTLAEACTHPNWSMGRKITIDSASLVNKGLELIEAVRLFDIPEDRIDVVVHRESIVHSMAEFCDGAVMAQMAVPDMRLCIQYALTYPDKIPGLTPRLDLAKVGRLTFYEVDGKSFPSVDMARRAVRTGGIHPCIFNSANEKAVELFCEGRIRFTDIFRLIDKALSHFEPLGGELNLSDIVKADRAARDFVENEVERTDWQNDVFYGEKRI